MAHSLRIVALLLALSPTFSTVAAQLEEVTYCAPITSVDERSDLGGYFLNNGWERGFIELLHLTTIAGEVYGSLISVEQLSDGSYEQRSYSFTGDHDESQISLVIDGFFTTSVLTGNWGVTGIWLQWPSSDGGLASTTFEPISAYAAELILEHWPNHAGRQANADLQIAMMNRVATSSEWEATEADRVYADDAVSHIGFPTGNSIDLLINGWLASAHFSDQEPGSLPNQINWYAVHTFSTSQQASRAAACWMDLNGVSRESLEEVSSPYGSFVAVEEQEGEYVIVSVIAIHGSNLITARLYGGHAVFGHGIDMVIAIVEDIGEIH